MSKAERLAVQHAKAAEEAAEYLRHRQLLAPRPLAVHIAAMFGYHLPLWRTPAASLWLYYELGALVRPQLRTLSANRERA